MKCPKKKHFQYLFQCWGEELGVWVEVWEWCINRVSIGLWHRRELNLLSVQSRKTESSLRVIRWNRHHRPRIKWERTKISFPQTTRIAGNKGIRVISCFNVISEIIHWGLKEVALTGSKWLLIIAIVQIILGHFCFWISFFLSGKKQLVTC